MIIYAAGAHQACPQLVHTDLFKRLFIREKYGEPLSESSRFHMSCILLVLM